MLEVVTLAPGARPALATRATDRVAGFAVDRGDAERELRARTDRLDVLAQRLYAEGTRAVLVVLQGMDTSGKDGAIKNVFRGMSPSGTRVAAFKAPSESELAHDYLLRVHSQCPERGHVGIFNRSHYEDVLAARVRGGLAPKRVKQRYRHINEFERLLTDEGTTVVKCFLHLSK
ncbi:MAG: hypothetical protein QOI47_417, partial [Actinomycetota bacterium]|nr:hypothetical protein [Actinomycetota bacterium]